MATRRKKKQQPKPKGGVIRMGPIVRTPEKPKEQDGVAVYSSGLGLIGHYDAEQGFIPIEAVKNEKAVANPGS